MTLIVGSLNAAARQRLASWVTAAYGPPLAQIGSPAGIREVLPEGVGPALVLTGLTWRDGEAFVRDPDASASRRWRPVLVLEAGANYDARSNGAGHAASVVSLDMPEHSVRPVLQSVEAGMQVIDEQFIRTERDSPDSRPARLLTTREREVLALLVEGASNKRICRALAISPNTAKFHLRALFRKLGCASRAEAVAVGLKSGALDL